MIVQWLIELRDRLGTKIPPPYHQQRQVVWCLELDADGQFLGWTTLGKTVPGKKPRGLPLVVPYRRRSSDGSPHLFVDKYHYFTGLPVADDNDHPPPEKAARHHQMMVDLVQALCDSSNVSTTTQAVLRFLTGNGPAQAAKSAPEGLLPTHVVAVRMDGKWPHEDPQAIEWWVAEMDKHSLVKSKLTRDCMHCGEVRPIPLRAPVEIRIGKDRPQLISANCSPFQHYGAEANHNAPLCQTCARKYGEALRYLLSKPEHHFGIGNVIVLCWTRGEEHLDFRTYAQEPSTEAVARLFNAPVAGRGGETVAGDDFYMLVVSTNSSRLVVRDASQMKLHEVKAALRCWFERQRVFWAFHDGPGDPHGLYALVSSATNNMKKVPPRTMPMLIASALYGKPLPRQLLAWALARSRAEPDRRITRPRASLIRMLLNDMGMNMPEGLDLTYRNRGYLCGRLLAVMESIQYKALGETNTTITSRFFGAAVSCPRRVFPRMFTLTQKHLAKLDRDEPGAGKRLRRQCNELIELIGVEYPGSQSLADQGAFQSGYVHQQQANIRAAMAAKAAKEAKREASKDED